MSTDHDGFLEYRALSRGAVVTLILAIVSPAYLMFPSLGFIPLIGTVVGLLALRSILKYPRELSGWVLGCVATGACGLVLVGGTISHVVTYATEVPDGYERISFQLLQPDPRRPQDLVPPEAISLDGRKIFIKGYVHPSVDGLGAVKQFVLVPDMGTCCFGGQPKLTDMIEVTTTPEYPVFYTRRKLRLAGTLKVDTKLKRVDGLTGVFYQMAADQVR